EDYYYKRGITPSEVGKVYYIDTYAKYKGREYDVARERENNGVKEYEISKGWTSDEELAFGRANGFKVDDRDRSVEKWVSEDELEIYEVKKEVDNFF
ncbi:MAG: hypothetical protein N4Q30_07575, partial [Neisseriaceae bacterium]|nr:hypothetical protein [Neisseriaceae bacterium]